MYKELRRMLKPIWTDKQKRFAIARIAKALTDECWYFVGASTRKNAVIRFLNGEAFVEIVDFIPVTEVYVPVSSVVAEIADIIPLAGCDPDEVAKAIAVRTWKNVQQGYSYQEPVLTVNLSPKTPTKKEPLSLFDFCK
jgi:hypothetical protein